MAWRTLSWSAGAAALALAAPAHAGDEAPEALRTSGTVGVVLGAQEANATSIYPVEGRVGETALVSRKAAVTMKIERRSAFAVVADLQYEERPYGEDRGRVNQLFASVDLGEAWRLRVGKQRTLWGHGFSYIPTDFINPPLDPSGLDPAKIGVGAATLDYVGENYSATLLARRERDSVDSGGVKFATSAMSGLDLNLVYYHAPSIGNGGGLSFSADAQQLVWSRLDGLVLFGAFAVHTRSRYPEVLPAGAGAMAGVPAVGSIGTAGRYRSWLAGGTYQVTGDLSLTAEYYRIGDAYQRAQYADILRGRAAGGDLAAASAPWLGHLAYGRNQNRYASLSLNQVALTSGSNRATDTLGVQLGLLYSPNDHSRLWQAGLVSNYWNAVEVSARAVYAAGGKATEFGTMPYRWYGQVGIKFGF